MLQKHPLGEIFIGNRFLIFFGNHRVDIENLERSFPEFQFSFLNQIHSDQVLEHNSASISYNLALCPRADAHWTTQSNVALCIRTADCLPVLLASSCGSVIAAAHAGWRGIESEIIPKTVSALAAQGAAIEGLRAWIGPHIGPKSFEVGREVSAKLKVIDDRHHGARKEEAILTHPEPDKNYIDLGIMARSQLLATGVSAQNIFRSKVDTLVSQDHHSFRRDGETAGRQISFVVKQKT